MTTTGELKINAGITTSNQPISLVGGNVTQAASTTVNAGTGAITVNAGTGTLTLNSSSLLLSGNASGTIGSINITADLIAFNATSQIGGTGAGTGSAQTVVIQPSTLGRSIGVAGGVGNLQLSTAALNRMFASNVRIGNSSAGAITIGTSATTWSPAATFATNLLTLDTASSITQTTNAPINLGTRNLLLRDSNSIALTNASNIFSNIAAATSAGGALSGPVQITANNALTVASLTDDIGGPVDGISTTGNITLTSTGIISESGSAFINGTLLTTSSVGGTTLNNANTITSFNAANTSSGLISLNNTATLLTITGISQSGGGSVTINNQGAIDIGASSIISGDLSVTANGAITQSGAIIANGNGKVASFDAGVANNINLASANNDFTTVVINNTNNASINDINDINLGASTVVGNLTIIAGGAVTQTGAINGSALLVKTLNDTGGAISLSNNANDFASVNLLSRNAADTTYAAGTITYKDASGFDVAGIGTTDGISLIAGNAITQTGTGLSAAIIGNSLSVLTLNDPGAAITLNNANNDVVSLQLNAHNAGGTADAFGAINYRDASGFDLAGVSTTSTLNLVANGAMTGSGVLTIGGASTIEAGATNDITLNNIGNNLNSIAIVSGKNVTINDATAIVMNTSTISGVFSLTTGGSITQTGPLSVAGIATLNSNGSDIILSDVNNDFAAVSISSANNVTLRDVNALDLSASTILGFLQVTASGDITQRGNLSVGTTTTLDAGSNNISLNGANTFSGNVGITHGNNVVLNNTVDLILNTSNITGNLDVTVAGNLTQSGALTVNGIATFDVGNTHDITLASGNDFNTVIVTHANNVTINNSNALNLGESVISGNLAIISHNLTQSGFLTVNGSSNFNVDGYAINLTNANNDFVGAVTIVNSGLNDVSIRDANSIVLAASSVGNNLTVQASGDITQTGALTVNGLTTLIAGNGNIILTNVTNDFASVAITRANNASLTDLNSLEMGSSNVANNLNIITGGNVTQSGALVIGGTASFNASTSDILLTDINNDFSTVTLLGNNVTIIDKNGVDIGSSTLGNSLTVTAMNGDITQSGPIDVDNPGAVASFSAAGHNIYLTNPDNAFTTIKFPAANNVTLISLENDNDAINLDTSTLTGTLDITAADFITQIGALTGTSLIIKQVNDAPAPITLTNSANEFATINLQVRNFADSAYEPAAIAYTDANGFDITGIGTASTVNLIAGGAITQSGAITGTTLTTSSVGGTLLSASNTITSLNATNAGSGNITFNNVATTLTVASINEVSGGTVDINNTGSINFPISYNQAVNLNLTASNDLIISHALGNATALASIDLTANEIFLNEMTVNSDALFHGWVRAANTPTDITITSQIGNITFFNAANSADDNPIVDTHTFNVNAPSGTIDLQGPIGNIVEFKGINLNGQQIINSVGVLTLQAVDIIYINAVNDIIGGQFNSPNGNMTLITQAGILGTLASPVTVNAHALSIFGTQGGYLDGSVNGGAGQQAANATQELPGSTGNFYFVPNYLIGAPQPSPIIINTVTNNLFYAGELQANQAFEEDPTQNAVDALCANGDESDECGKFAAEINNYQRNQDAVFKAVAAKVSDKTIDVRQTYIKGSY